MGFCRNSLSLVAVLIAGGSAFASEQLVERIVAVVGNETILQSELDSGTEKLREEMKKRGKESEIGTPEQVRTNVLDQLINQKLVDAEIEKRGLAADDRTVDGAVETVMQQNSIRNVADLRKALAQEGLTLEAYRTSLKKQIETSRLMNDAIRPRVRITDEDIDAAYKRKSLTEGERSLVRLRMILKKKGKGKDGEHAMLLLRKKIAAGVPFGRVADKETEGPGKGSGGALGLVDPSEMKPILGNAVRNLKVGEISDVISAEEGYYLLLAEERVKAGDAPLTKEAREELREELTQLETEREFDSFIRGLRDKGHIEVKL